MTNLSDLLPAGAASKQLSFTASGAISSGQTVGLKTDGTVEVIGNTAEAVGTETEFTSVRSDYTAAVYDVNANRIVIFYNSNNSGPYGVVGTVSGSSISFGTPVATGQGQIYSTLGAVYDSTNNKVLYGYRTGASSGLKVVVGTVDPSDNSITFGTAGAVDDGNNEDGGSMAYDTNAQRVVVSFRDANNSQYGAASVGTVSGTSISFGTPVVYTSTALSGTGTSTVYDPVSQKVLLGYRNNSGTIRGYGIVGTVSGTSISFGTAVIFSGSIVPEGMKLGYSTTASKILIVYEDSGTNNGHAVTATISGTSVSYGTDMTWVSDGLLANAQNVMALNEDTNANLMVLGFNNKNYQGQVVNFTISGDTVTASSITTWDSGTTTYYIGGAYHTVEKKTVFSWGQNNTTGEAITYSPAFSNASSFLGIADAAISNSASGKITMKGGVAINSAISPAAVVTAGSKVVFDDGGPTTGISLVYDPDNSKIVNAFCTTTLHGIVGTVSGTGITYGTAVQANSNNSGEAQIVYDTANDKVVVVYTNNNNSYGEAVVGTVSGTSISWGSVVVWNSASTGGLSAAYDTNAGKVLVAWKNSGTAYGIVGTVSGTSISFGSSATIFSGGNLQETRMVYDANAQKSVVAIRDYSPQKGYAVVATISGTSVTVGSSVEFLSSEVTNQSIALAYNSTDNNVVIAYSKAGDSNNGFLAIGTISGTSISFAGETKYSSSNQTNYVKLAYKSSGNMLGIIYNIGGSTTVKFNHATISGTTFSFGTEQELTAGATDSTAITLDVASDNFVASYGDGANSNDGTTNVVNLNTSLVPNTTYYVQNDGTLSTTSSTVTAGKAMSTTSINLDYST